MGKGIHRELCKKLEFDHTTKWYMRKPEFILENGIHKILWDIKIQTDHRIPTKRPDLVIINKKNRTCRIVYFAAPTEQKSENQRKRRGTSTWTLLEKLKKTRNMKVTVITIMIGAHGTISKGLVCEDRDEPVYHYNKRMQKTSTKGVQD